MQRHDALTRAVQATDLPALIAALYPASKAQPGTPGLFFAAWRGNSDTPALSLTRKQHVWLWHDLATDEGGNAFDFLVGPHEMERQEAARYLLEAAGIPLDGSADDDPDSHLRPVPPEAVRRLHKLSTGVPIEALRGRGFNRAMVERYGIRADGNDALIPITSPEGVVMQVKRRLHNKTGSGKYRYEHKGHGSPAWCSDNSRNAHTLLIVEGELNAIVMHAALQEAGDTTVGVMGLAGAKSDLYPGLSRGKTVYVYADDDKAGREALDAWADAARDDGAKSVHLCLSHTQDFCEVAGSKGRSALVLHFAELLSSATQRYGALDRLLANGSVREYLDAAQRFVEGGVLHRTGFHNLDMDTGGIRESGVFSIAALSSTGKSAVLRRMLLEHVRDGGIVRLYSPDQSARTIYRLLASLLSGVGIHELRTGRLSAHTRRLWGDPDSAKRAWAEAHQHVILELSQRFQATEEGEADTIFDDMERAVDQGVTMFGIDYLQGIEPRDHRDRDGLVAKELRKLSHRIGVPVISALQLAKYKYPPTRVSGIPIASDIEGSGAYYQDSEMVLMLYNEEIFRHRHAGPSFVPEGHLTDEGVLYVRKDKEGSASGVHRIVWNERLVTYHDNRLPWNLEAERKGLMD